MITTTDFPQSELLRVAERLHAAADALDPIYLRAKGTSAGDFALDRINRLREAAYRLEADDTAESAPSEPDALGSPVRTPDGAATGRAHTASAGGSNDRAGDHPSSTPTG